VHVLPRNKHVDPWERFAMDDKLKKKSFCKWGKENIKANISDILALTEKPKYVCLNCARVAKRKANLCKPEAFKKKK
jgi:hypothetical protein